LKVQYDEAHKFLASEDKDNSIKAAALGLSGATELAKAAYGMNPGKLIPADARTTMPPPAAGNVVHTN
jgi:hypothetical protein